MSQVLAAVVMSGAVPAMFDGKQRSNFDGVPLWEVEVALAVTGGGASVLRLRIAAASAPGVSVGQSVKLSGLRARAWEMEGPDGTRRHGVSWSADSIARAGLPMTPGAGSGSGKRES
ncbi:hypothetical protein I6A60_12305 [Frankia sp. AgB1.9]|nr:MULTISPECIES: hypothetical protein [unclassified Frankia]MBL7548652.1 hypothetical protein [Frankia sp. AgB1.9]